MDRKAGFTFQPTICNLIFQDKFTKNYNQNKSKKNVNFICLTTLINHVVPYANSYLVETNFFDNTSFFNLLKRFLRLNLTPLLIYITKHLAKNLLVYNKNFYDSKQ